MTQGQIFKPKVGIHLNLGGHRIPLVDFTKDNRISIEDYGKGDHLSRQRGQRRFTRILGEALKPLMDAPE